MLGLLSSAPLFSLLECAERVLGSWSTSAAAICLFWGAVGTVVALLTKFVVPHRQIDQQESR
jgi:hypothetical protein